MTFPKGASAPDPSGLFNASQDGNTQRAIGFHEGDKVNEKALKARIQAAVAVNNAGANVERTPKRVPVSQKPLTYGPPDQPTE